MNDRLSTRSADVTQAQRVHLADEPSSKQSDTDRFCHRRFFVVRHFFRVRFDRPSLLKKTTRGGNFETCSKVNEITIVVNKIINNIFDIIIAFYFVSRYLLCQTTVNTLALSNADIVRDLGEDIVFGVFHPKERLTEEDLMARFGVKRHVVREVLTQLDSMGLVVRVPNRGAYVRELTPEEVIEIYEVREILEVAAALRTPLPAPKEVLAVLKQVQDQHSKAIANHDLRSVFRLNIQFHRQQFLACQNAKLAQSIMEYAQQAHLIRAIKYAEAGHLQKVERVRAELSTVFYDLSATITAFKSWIPRRAFLRFKYRSTLPVPRNAQHTETIVATKIGLLHGTSSVPGVRGEQRFDGNKVQAPECLLADLDLLHELKIGRFQQAADRQHGALHDERVAGMQFQPPVGRHPYHPRG
jgi:DNA-binding GntR family transcriptional regulator